MLVDVRENALPSDEDGKGQCIRDIESGLLPQTTTPSGHFQLNPGKIKTSH